MKTLRLVVLAAAITTFGFSPSAHAEQEHMDQAITLLQQARAQLEQADRNKGGYRVKAMADIDQVISDIQAGKAAARANR